MLLALHVAAGTTALALGPLVLAGRRGPDTAYRLLVLCAAVTALPLTAASTLPVGVRAALVAVALGSGAAVVRGSEPALRGSYVSLVAALAFVSGPLWSGALVVVLGSAAAHLLPPQGRPDAVPARRWPGGRRVREGAGRERAAGGRPRA